MSELQSLDDITDPSDWPVKNLQEVDSLLRCGICYDYVNAAMILLDCSHNYCSICIRRHLASEQYCPVCRKSATETKMANNRVLDQLVLVLNAHRKQNIDLLHFALRSNDKNVSMIENHDKSDEPVENVRTKDFTPVESQMAIATERIEGDIVRCPICDKMVKNWLINMHIDSCLRKLDNESLKSDMHASGIPKTPGKRKAKICYSLLDVKKLRKLLDDEGLSTIGDKPLLTWRHQEYCLLYSANLDSENPKSDHELKRELSILERQRLTKKASSSEDKTHDLENKPDSEEQAAMHLQRYQNQFDNLTEVLIQRQKKEDPRKRKRVEDFKNGQLN